MEGSWSCLILFGFAVGYRVVLYLALRWRKMTQWRQASGEVASKRGVARFCAKLMAFLNIYDGVAKISDTHTADTPQGRKSGSTPVCSSWFQRGRGTNRLRLSDGATLGTRVDEHA